MYIMKLNFKGLLKNKYVLYAVLFIAVTNVLGYLAVDDYKSLTLFIAVGVLSTYFSKNMIVNLGSAILITALFSARGMVEGMTSEEPTKKGKTASKCSKGLTYQTAGSHNGCCKKGDSLDETSGKCVTKKGKQYNAKPALESFTQKNIPKSTPAPADESMEDEQVGKRVDYAATLEQAYNNLENVLGKDGIDGLAKETQTLIGQQETLMKTLNTMSPVLQNAQETIKSFDLESLTKNLGSLGNFMKKN